MIPTTTLNLVFLIAWITIPKIAGFVNKLAADQSPAAMSLSVNELGS